MKVHTRYRKVLVNDEPRYVVDIRKNFLHKWKPIVFTIIGTGEKRAELDALELGNVSFFNEDYLNIPEDIRRDVCMAKQEIEIKDHCENRYFIHKWSDPEHTRCAEVVCKGKTIGDLSDGYHTFNQLYDFRREYNAALVNSGIWPAHKSRRHHDGELCFGGGWFIVMIETPFGQISNHYEDRYWDEFHCDEKEFADEWDGHTDEDVLERLKKCNEKVTL